MPNPQFSNIKEKIIYVAMLLEGEGSFTTYQNGTHPRIALAMTDFDVVERIRDIMSPSSNIRSQEGRKAGWKVQYVITIDGQRAAEWMMTLYTLMSVRRKEQIRKVLQAWKEHRYIGSKERVDRAQESRKNNKMIKMVMLSRKISHEEAEKVLEDSLSSIEKQTIN